ncbi:inositol monophosphatase family protein [Streptococcus caprae]|uniref:Inositol monophosphatase family protein n=1 Tax=Streptococcus caprae TaxID=1640501 RepID=A0ABV8CXZ8_9STRE
MENKFAFGKKIIKEAGKFILSRMFAPVTVETKSRFDDLVTSLDKETQDLLVSRILDVYPEDKILAEESQTNASITDDRVWVIDPIDGTTNFIVQKSDFVVMLSYFEKGVGKFGLIYDVVNDQLFSGGPDFRAQLNGNPLETYESRPLNETLIISNAGMFARNSHGVADLAAQTLGSRTYGSAGLSMSRVMSGKAILYTSCVYPWDYAAAAVIGQTLGYEVLTLSGEQPDYQTRQEIMFFPTEEKSIIQTYIH